ncbi:MAG: RNA-directed DNA polymerase [Desulfobaccales bacterium]
MTTKVDIGGITTNMKDVVRQLKHDLKDDWYPDSLGYEDTLEPELISEAIVESINANDGLYVPGCRAELNIPKKGFVLRYSLETSLLDRAYYHALVATLSPFYDKLLSPVVLSHRYAFSGHRADRYLFLHPIEQWKLFKGYIALEAANKNVVLVTDVQNYFENIKIDILIGLLRERVSKLTATGTEKARIRTIIDHLARCLSTWCFCGTHGLPQNRDASSFLGNIVMLIIDEAMLKLGYVYFRYMDDIQIVTSSRYKARSALQDLIVELRKIGLNVNASKTKILEPDTPEYFSEILSQGDQELEQIDNMWRSRSLPVIRRSFEPLRRLAIRMITENHTQERAFRFCVKRFENLALCKEIDIPASYFEPMIEAAITELDTQPCSTDQLVRFLKAAPTAQAQIARVAAFLKDHDRAIYDWQNYLLWQLIVYKEHHDPELLSIARKRIKKSSLQADRAGAMLFLGALGEKKDRETVAGCFVACTNHLLQRNALIAVHELAFEAGIKQHVAPHVLPYLKGTYRRIRESFSGCYHRPLPLVSYLDIYDDVTSYE